MERPKLQEYMIKGKNIDEPAKKLEECKTNKDYTVYAIDELLKSKSGTVMSIMEAHRNVIRTICPKVIDNEWGEEPAKWDVAGTQHQLAIAGYMFFSKKNEKDVFAIDQYDGPPTEDHMIECTACVAKKGGGPMKECIALNVDGYDFLKGACLNCYYKGATSTCSLFKTAKELEQKRKHEKAGGFGGIPAKVLEAAPDDELREWLQIIEQGLAAWAETMEDKETPRKKQKKRK